MALLKLSNLECACWRSYIYIFVNKSMTDQPGWSAPDTGLCKAKERTDLKQQADWRKTL